jgi:hypothetical protein
MPECQNASYELVRDCIFSVVNCVIPASGSDRHRCSRVSPALHSYEFQHLDPELNLYYENRNGSGSCKIKTDPDPQT